eukprot:14749874-Alexandrium_andersonii.AAC.1
MAERGGDAENGVSEAGIQEAHQAPQDMVISSGVHGLMVDDQLVEGSRAKRLRVPYYHAHRQAPLSRPLIVDDRLIEGARITPRMQHP